MLLLIVATHIKNLPHRRIQIPIWISLHDVNSLLIVLQLLNQQCHLSREQNFRYFGRNIGEISVIGRDR